MDLRRINNKELSVRVTMVCAQYKLKTIHSALKFAEKNRGKQIPFNGCSVGLKRFEKELIEFSENRL